MKTTRATKIIAFSVPPSVVKEVERVAKAEHRTPSELFCEMFRVYKHHREHQEEQNGDDWVMDLIREAQEEQKTNPMTPEQIVAELKEFGREIAAKAKERGIQAKDVNRIIYESRKRWGTA